MDAFDLLVRTETLLWNRLEASLLSAGRVGLGTLQALRAVRRHDGRGRVEDLRRALVITNGAASKLVDRIERAGLVNRTPNPEDRRSSLLALTDTGEAERTEGEAVVRRLVDQVIDETDAAALTLVLGRIKERLAGSPDTVLAGQGQGEHLMPAPDSQRLSLKTLPQGTLLRSVTAATGRVEGRTGTRVSLTDDIARHGVPGVDYVDQPTMVLLPIPLRTGSISVDIHSRLTDEAPDYARGFAGIAFHVTPSFDHFEAVYLRPTNGTLTNPGKPREGRGIQYFAYPDWPFDRLRTERPDAGYESAARIAPSRWAALALDIGEDQVSASVDGIEVLRIAPLVPPSRGGIGLFVDIGTDAHFTNLVVTPSEGRYSPSVPTPASWPDHPGGPAYTTAETGALLDELRGDH